jgi:hypothetical protein
MNDLWRSTGAQEVLKGSPSGSPGLAPRAMDSRPPGLKADFFDRLFYHHYINLGRFKGRLEPFFFFRHTLSLHPILIFHHLIGGTLVEVGLRSQFGVGSHGGRGSKKIEILIL